MEFAGRSVVITGVGRAGQLGEVVAQEFAARGARVFLVDRQESEARARADAIVAAGGRAASLAAELTDPLSVHTLGERIREATVGKVHALVHLAGGFALSDAVADSDPETWHAQLSINATSAYLVARAFIPLLRPVRGAAVFIASEAVLPGARIAGMSAYAAAKGVVVTLMQAIAQEEAAHGVRANAIAPAAIRTAANLASMPAGTPLVAREAVADVAIWLASDAARAVSGLLVPVR